VVAQKFLKLTSKQNYLNVNHPFCVYNKLKTKLQFFSHYLADPKNIKRSSNTVTGPRSPTNIATVLFTSFCMLGIVLVMATKQKPKHRADVLNRKVVF
jgi:hypothetical protein